ncbi:MAG TPA: CBS domain-containing protein [Candidatus Nitrosotalea sp.]|nr:CBS domain-containing protein [Candidatus Nitrosotalea sp.]
MDEYFASQIMSHDVLTVEQSTQIIEAAKKMNERNIGCIIVTERGNPVGIVTERDIVSLVARNERPITTPVREIMSSPLVSVSPDATVWELAEEMKLKKIHKMPIIDKNKLVGIVTTTDITRLCSIGSDAEIRSVCQQILKRLNQP